MGCRGRDPPTGGSSMTSNLPRTLALGFMALLMIAPAQAQVPDVFATMAPTLETADALTFTMQSEAIETSVEAADVVADATGDEDRDGIPDDVENLLCQSGLVADTINTVDGTLDDSPANAPVATCGDTPP